MRNIHLALIVLLCLFAVATLSLAGGITEQEVTALSGQTVTPKSERMREWERQQEKARNTQRHEDLKRDTDKLLQLATDLKLSVDRSNEHTLSMDVIKKAGEVEKLAKDIQKKMKGD